ncbi:MAG TPA: hypothetical protein VMK12_12540, partial [Anaeromyxobacteraceae bacterium]|nr:hypothetical protein [Anaeromyxobacteraceae bacterium]
PRATARAYFEAVTRGDAETALSLVDNPTDADRLTVQVGCASELALERLEELTLSRFGERGALGVALRRKRLLEAVDRAPVHVNGSLAVIYPDDERPVRLHRVRDRWKIESPVDRLTETERKTLQKTLEETERTAREIGERVRSGAIKEGEEAAKALRRLLDDSRGVPL